LVGAPRFELGTSCAQASRAIFLEVLPFQSCFEMYRNVAPHAQSPLNSPSTKIRRKHKSGLLNSILCEQTVYLIQDFDPFLVSISQFVGQFPANCRVGRFLHGTSRSTATGIIVRRQAFPVPITALAPVWVGNLAIGRFRNSECRKKYERTALVDAVWHLGCLL
jgi:hypothetical protein